MSTDRVRNHARSGVIDVIGLALLAIPHDGIC